ncbi:19047_t:CDS:1 [Cetraspora pellucida]|uniref:19047_t:CDS:1 n=1 Tax=Cetraspora pellucida TaxID=1433469 RepID=A0A9N9P2M0_9GLOM|nr:19047_t:CDS:1 [Cetraspora pellucida]
MSSRYIYISLLVLCAPLIILVVASFTSLAIFTSTLAVVVISIRLAFLMVEFSCGVALDFAGWGAKKFMSKDLTNANNSSSSIKIKESHISSANKQSGKKLKSNNSSLYSNHSNHTYYKNSSIKPLSKHSPKVPVWDVDTFDGLGDNGFVSNDDYFTMSPISNKRPDGRRVRSGYL